MTTSQDVIIFIKQFFYLFLVKSDFSALFPLFNDYFSWVGVSNSYSCSQKSDLTQILEDQRTAWWEQLTISQDWYQSIPLAEQSWAVYGEMTIRERGNPALAIPLQFTMVCASSSDALKLIHGHLSRVTLGIADQPPGVNLALQQTLVDQLLLKNQALEIIYDHVDFGIIKSDLMDATVTLINEKALAILGYTREQYKQELDDKITSFVCPEYLSMVQEHTQVLLNTGGPIKFKAQALRRDGQSIWLGGYGVVVAQKTGTNCVIYTFQDITEEEYSKILLIQKNEALAISEQRYELVIAQANIITFDYVLATDQLILSEAAMKKFALPQIVDDACQALIASDLIHPNSVDALKDLYTCIGSGASSAEDVLVILDKNGKETTNVISLMTLFDGYGHGLRIIGFMRDISEKRILQSENQFQKAMASDKVLSYEVNLSRDLVIYLNEAWLISIDLPHFSRFSQMIAHIIQHVVHPNDVQSYRAFFDPKNLMTLLAEGQNQSYLEYRRLGFAGQYNWVENTLNMIQDDLTADIKIRCYSRNIDLEKQKQLKILEEQRFYETMFSNSMTAYEVNITQDAFVRGHENWGTLFKIKPTNNYSQMMAEFIARGVSFEDADQFKEKFLRQNVLKAYHDGQKEIYCQYRRPDALGQVIWVACTMHLLESPETKDLKGYAYIQDINEDKQKELALVYKSEHDSLTGLLNKGALELHVQQFLLTTEGKSGNHAFLIFDLDHFKSVNDNLGHVFGDVVLSQMSQKAKELFREDDILGRIGGDEFVVLMKNIPTEKIVKAKATEMCATLRESYTQNGIAYPVTISIGIAMYPTHGDTYTRLYENSDTALYVAKNNGKDQFTFYDVTMFSNTLMAPKPIEVSNLLESKNFESNISEYVFRILYDSPNKNIAITSVLELIGKYYHVSRAYIFENTLDNRYCNNTFEWCNIGITPQIDNLQNVSYVSLGNYTDNFNEEGIFFLPDLASASEGTRQVLAPQNVVSMLQCTIMRNGVFSGFVGFDYCYQSDESNKEGITALRNVSNILGVFLIEMRTNITNESTKNAALSIANALESYAYVIDKDSYELLFINDKTKMIAPATQVGDYCYQAFWQRTTPCDACPMSGLSLLDLTQKCSIELHNTGLKVWIRATASWINWTDGQRACLMDCVDITEYK